ncbi:MAG TPA: tetratricopeptide repeat protein [Vicinamibacterales bacterium]|jgi:tetratricopeptide (TPR) repeat protein
MKLVVFVALLGLATPVAARAQGGRANPPAQPPDRVAEAYDQFLRAHLLEDGDDTEGAIAAYKKALAADPRGADIAADLADLYLRENRAGDARNSAEQAIKIDPNNREGHRVLGTLYASMASDGQGRGGRAAQTENLNNAVLHLEKAIEPPIVSPDANVRAMLARLYIATDKYDKAIALLSDLVKQEPGWQDGPTLLVQAYSAAGRSADAVKWLEEAAEDNPQLFGTLAELYGRQRRWSEAVTAYEQALRDATPRTANGLRVGLATALLASGKPAELTRARDVLRQAVSGNRVDERALALLSQAERRTGDYQAAESTARRLITQNARNARGYVALAEALEEQRRFQPIVETLAPAATTFRGSTDTAFALAMLLPHLGFAYQELAQYDKAIATFEELSKLAPEDTSVTGYLVQAHIAAKSYAQAAEIAHTARTKNPGDIRLARLEAQALRKGGKVDQGLAILEDLARKRSNDPTSYIALAQGYADASRGSQAIKVLQEAQAKFPDESSITFELASVLEKQKKFGEAEAVFRQLIAKDPENAAALNYLGYMLAERGERLTESVDFLKRALAIEPNNGSFLDSIGWAYYKDGKLDLAFENLKLAADQLPANSVVQDHYGDVLSKMGRWEDAIAAWNRALAGDGDAIDKGDIDKKIKSARQKLPKR